MVMHIIVVGAGITGILTAIYLARRGFNVQVHEQSPSDSEIEAAVLAGRMPGQPNSHVLLASRALLAFKELKLELPFSNVDGQNIITPLAGILDVMTGKVEDWSSSQSYTQSAVLEYKELRSFLLKAAKQMFPSRICFNWSSRLEGVNFDKKTASFSKTGAVMGSTMTMAADRKKPRMGNSMFASVTRPSKAATPAGATIPAWDTVSLAAEASDAQARGATIPAWDTVALAAAAADAKKSTTIPAWDMVALAAAAAGAKARGATIPAWDTVALAAAAADAKERGVAEGATEEQVELSFDMLVGADGAHSHVRECMTKAKVHDFFVQQPMIDEESFGYFTGLPFPSVESTSVADFPIPGLASHTPRQYLYRYEARSTPTLEMWMPEEGSVSGTISGVDMGDGDEVAAQLKKAYGSRLPASWLEAIVKQTIPSSSTTATSTLQPTLHSCGATVQCSKFDAPHAVLLGDAAHQMTGELRQSLKCSIESVRPQNVITGIESVRLLNVIFKISADQTKRAPMVFSEIRREDAHCMQTLEQMERKRKPNAVSGDAVFAVFSWMSAMVYRSAALSVMILHKFLPDKISPNWIREQLRDGRRGYHEVVKLFTRFAALPILLCIAVVGVVNHQSIITMFA
eukprot:gene1228-32570_t